MATFRALVLHEEGGKVVPRIEAVDEALLPPGEVTVAVECSTLNYKDGMILQGIGRLGAHLPAHSRHRFRRDRRALGIARVRAGRPGHPDRLAGRRDAMGRLCGEGAGQGFATWCAGRRELTARQAMAIGTAGLTAMLAVIALERHGLRPGSGDVLVTGAAGGVGSIAVSLLSQLGHRVVASTGRPELRDYLTELGAADLIDRATLAAKPARPLDSERWAGAVDAVGGTTLATILTPAQLPCERRRLRSRRRQRLAGDGHPISVARGEPLGDRLGDVPARRADRGVAAARPRSAARPSRTDDPDGAAIRFARPGAKDPQG